MDPNTYDPERWLSEADSKYSADRKEAYEPFQVGPRNCLGKLYADDTPETCRVEADGQNRLAWAEMKLILCKVLWNFDMELAGGNKDDWSMEQKVYLLYERTPVYVKLTSIR